MIGLFLIKSNWSETKASLYVLVGNFDSQKFWREGAKDIISEQVVVPPVVSTA